MPIPYLARPRVLEWAVLALILILAIVLRLGAPGIVEFKTDEANLSVLSLDMVHGHGIPLLGIDSSVGIRNAPVSVYLMAIPYLFTTSPEAATAFVGLLGVLSMLLMYVLVRRYYGPLAALVAAALYAVGPWAVIFTRKIWAQDLLPVFVLMAIGAALLGFVEGKRWAQLACLPLLAITLQIHYGAFVIVPAIVYLIIAGRKRLSKQFIVSIALAVLVLVPYLIGAVQGGLLSGDSLRKVLAPGDKPRSIGFSPDAFQYSADAITGTNLESVIGTQAWPKFAASVPYNPQLFNILLAAVVASGIWLVFRLTKIRDRRTPVDIALLLWLVATPLAFALTWTAVYMHYMIPLLIAAFMVIGIGVSDFWNVLSLISKVERRVIAGVVGALLLAVIVLQVWVQIGLYGFVAKNATPGGFATPLGYYMGIREAVRGYHPQNVLAKLDGQYIGYHGEASIWYALLYEVPSVRMLDDQTDVYPAEPALVLSHDCTAKTRNFELRPGEPCYAISIRTAADFKADAYQKANPNGLRFANGAKITAYRWEADPGCLSVVWTVNGPAPKEDFQFAVHFLNAAKQEIVTADSLSWRGRYWREGDTVINRYCLKKESDKAKQADIAGVQLGMYLYEDTAEGPKFYSQDLYDANGATAGQQIEIMFDPS